MFLGYIDPGSGFTFLNLGAWIIALLFGFFSFFILFFRKLLNFLKPNKKKSKVIFLFMVIIGLAITGAVMNKTPSKFDKKIILLGFDGLSPDILEPLMRDNLLPNFSRLQKTGSYRHLSTTNPSQSPVAWAGLATGKNPAENGIFDFIARDPKDYSLHLTISNVQGGHPKKVIKSECFWQYASEVQVPTILINYPLTFPPEKISGKMLAGMGVPDVLGTEGTFTFYTTKELDSEKDIGGNVFHINKSSFMKLDLIGPRIFSFPGNPENVTVPFQVFLEEDKDAALIKLQNNSFELKTGCWSAWKNVTFSLGMFRKMRGILRFYLVETQPEFKLYVSPVNFDPRAPFFPLSYPKDYSRKLTEDIGLYYTQGMPLDTWAVNEKRIPETALLEQAKEVLRTKTAMLNLELKRFKKGILFCYFGSTDTIQHMFWRYTDLKHPLYEEDATKQYQEVIKNWYIKMDAVLGEVLSNLNPEDTLIVLSDHGFSTFRRTVHLNSWLKKYGYLTLKDGVASGCGLFKDIDWSKTKAYAVGFGAIYLNQKGRERNGIVAPGAETEDLKEEIAQKLMAWHDEKDNAALINHIYKQQDLFHGRYKKDTPDLYLGFNTGYRASWQTALGDVPEELVEDNLKKWSGDHLFDPVLIPGVILSNKQINKENPSIYDLTPTILKIIGYSKEGLEKCSFDGKPLL
jgi:predicted AlkP superfamily phosphohydrolase/phosphomutase